MKQIDSANSEKTRWKPKREDIFEILRQHKTWLDSDGREGNRAEIYHADLSGADLHKANLRGARIWDTYLYEADLRGADLAETEGIKTEFFAGADLSGVRLPEENDRFDKIDAVESYSKSSRRIFWVLLILLHYSWFTLASVTDANLLSRIDIIPILPLALMIPAIWFFTIMPLILLVLYIIFHLSLQRNWEAIAELPAVFPDGTPVNKKIYQWFANRLIKPRPGIAPDKGNIFARIVNIFWAFAIRWLAPCTIIWFWFRYLTKHDWSWSGFHIFVVTFSVMFAAFFYFLTRRTLTARNLKGSNIFIRLGYFIIVLAIFFSVTYGILESAPPGYSQGSPGLTLKIMSLFGYNPTPDFSGGEISIRSDNWTGADSQILSVAGANLRDLRAPYSTGRHAFMAKADLSHADLKFSILDSADLREVNLTGAKLNSASLIGADLQGANLEGVNIDRANLLGTNLRNVRGLTINALHSATNWLNALYGGAILDSLNLPPDHNEKISAKNLSGYNLRGVSFKDAVLAGFNLTGANLQGADLTDADISGANLFLTDLRGTIGLNKQNLQSALHWLFALYDEEFLAEFGLPAAHNELAEKRDFRSYNLTGFNLTAADFSGANLRQVNLQGAMLNMANLRDADLYAVDLSKANLRDADLRGTILLDTDLRGADLTGVTNLTMDQIRWAIYDSSTIFPEYLKDQAMKRLQGK